ncbi:hypothetical protein MHLNE_03490 [Moorella humiferrea]|uniref:hypothetical protein n=1 Tax=Neomoorella humiferrea TaxID=676965 RepID=UPI0030CF8790
MSSPRLDPGMALLLALSLYPQQRHLLPDQFEVLMKLVFESVLQRVAEWPRLRQEMERYVYISGYGPADPPKNVRLVEGILQAIRLAKRVRLTGRKRCARLSLTACSAATGYGTWWAAVSLRAKGACSGLTTITSKN